MSFVLAAILILIVAAFVLRPVLSVSKSISDLPRHQPELETLEERRANTLEALTDLGFDHATGKISEEDYNAERKLLEAEAVEILRKLDAFLAKPGSNDGV